MESARIPKVLRLLESQRNAAADAAIVESLAHLDDPALGCALDILARRGHEPALRDAVLRIGSFKKDLQARIAQRAPALSGALRMIMQSPDVNARACAVAVIVRGGYTPMAMLLADALRSEDRQTRRLAGSALFRFATYAVKQGNGGHHLRTIAGATPTADVGQALARAIHLWDIHRLPSLIEAALWFPEWTMRALCGKLEEPRMELLRPVTQMLSHRSDPRLAAFAVRALGVPHLQQAACRCIRTIQDPVFLRAVLDHSWLLADDSIRRGLRRISSLEWVGDETGLWDELDDDRCRNAVCWVAALSGNALRRIERLRDLVAADPERLTQPVAWQLITDSSNESTTLLHQLTDRLTGGLARCANAELRRRSAAPCTARAGESESDGATPADAREAFRDYWNRFGPANEEKAAIARARLQPFAGRVPALVRERLELGEPSVRRKALRVIRDLALTEDFTEQIYRAAFDTDAAVRGTAVSMLADLPGPTAARILAQALNDPDQRVQANAIDVLDRRRDTCRATITKPKLASEHNRVRASAIRLLLPLDDTEAGAALLEMLEHPSRRHRVSALWVVGRLRLRTLAPRILSMASTDRDRRIRKLATDVGESLQTSHRW